MDQKRKPARQWELSRQTNSSDKGIKDRTLSEGFKDGGKVSGVTEHIDTNSQWKLGSTAAEKLAQHRTMRDIAKNSLKAVPVLSAVSQITPAIADVKDGMPNTAAARMLTSLAPMGTEEVQDSLMNRAQMEDKSPELLDPTYINTLKKIGERRAREGRSPVVESFSGQEIDTSATESNDFLNRVKAKMRASSNS